ncbi:acyclic terpene utilization AtuA family protein [Caenimonas koreensis]|uniref:Acyclic terpene utilization AtuA family protein n=1 Tax=Caenimonas koreensis DSM 17982 TaxID=1121255 RepID=A0A844BB36_9BURK|nr:acyclic terpene utilization AtuA family protein [Caenimonas koreensis]MRD48779.1 acyclic terpene utilization AtuA family protein [Caenimonas koreensis DSM 17982]
MNSAKAAGKVVRIGGASGFWGDSSVGAPQLVQHGQVNYLVFDYLAELTMSILAAARAKDPELGYATDFVSVTLKSILKDVAAQGIRVISNAGGVNPKACARAIEALATQLGVSIKVAVVVGDDVLPLAAQLREEGTVEMQSGTALPEHLLTANAYLGALPVKEALDDGAQIVVTGRCVDSAVTLGALMHEFGWQADDYALLAQGSLAGHIIECGCQATGGLHTDWEDVPDWPHIGYPVIECAADGSFVVTKPPGTGGLVNTAVVREQILYEIGDPQRYLLPDVTCDFSEVRVEQVPGAHRVRVTGARGLAPGPSYKVSATYLDGFRCSAQLTIVGIDAVRKAQRTGEAILERTRELFRRAGLADYSRTKIELLGSELGNFGPHANGIDVREVVLRVSAMHPQKAALDIFAREIAPAGTSWSPGTTGADGRPRPSPAIKQFAFLVSKQRVQPRVITGESARSIAVPAADLRAVPAPERPEFFAGFTATDWDDTGEQIEVPLVRLAWGRSGDKGDTSNIGIIARQPEWLSVLREQLSEERVAQWLAHLVTGTVTRYDLPGLHAMNFVCTRALDGGGMASLRNDPLGKGMAQILLTMPVTVPKAWLD